MNIDEPVGPGRQAMPGLFGNRGGMVAQNQPDGRVRRIVDIKFLERFDEFPTPVRPMDPGDRMSILKIHDRQNGRSSQTLAFIVPRDCTMFSQHQKKIWGGHPRA